MTKDHDVGVIDPIEEQLLSSPKGNNKQKAVKLALKLVVAGGLIYWLIQSGRLDLSTLSVYTDKPEISLAYLLIWTFGFLFLGGMRWHMLLRVIPVTQSIWKTVQLQGVGLFFNTVMPGSVGGDLIKAVYVIKGNRCGKTPVLMTVLIDRIVGMMGMFCLAGLGVMIDFDRMYQLPALRPVLALVLAGLMGTGLLIIFVFIPDNRIKFLISFINKSWPGFGAIKKIVESLRAYGKHPQLLIAALGIAIGIQSILMCFFWALSESITGQSLPITSFAAVYAVGNLVVAVPVSPGGIGVGHYAFDRLFSYFNWSGGANCFNAFLLGQMSLNLLGVLAYLSIQSVQPSEKS